MNSTKVTLTSRVHLLGYECKVEISSHGNHRTIFLTQEKPSRAAAITASIPEIAVEEDEIPIKDYLLRPLVDAGILEDTGISMPAPTGYMVPIARLTQATKEELASTH